MGLQNLYDGTLALGQDPPRLMSASFTFVADLLLHGDRSSDH